MKKQVSGIVQNPSLGVVSNRPLTNAEKNPVRIPDLNDQAAINAQREALRQEELNRYKQGGN